jgi:hypothetical protein
MSGRRGTSNVQGGAIFASSSKVLLVQTTAVSTTRDHYSGSTFTHYCYDGFYHNAELLSEETANCTQCLAGRYKNFTLNPEANSCKECPEVLYSLCTVLYSLRPVLPRAGTVTPLLPRPAARTAQSAQPDTMDQALAQLPAPLA